MTRELKEAKENRVRAMASLRAIRKTMRKDKAEAAQSAPATEIQEEARRRVFARQVEEKKSRSKRTSSLVTPQMQESATEEAAAREERQETAVKPRRPRWQREIMSMVRSTCLVIPKAPFTRLCKEVLQDVKPSFRIQATAIGALQESSEQFLTGTMEDCSLVAAHAKRVTIQPKDMQLVLRLRKGQFAAGNFF
jgi:histone H3/H4